MLTRLATPPGLTGNVTSAGSMATSSPITPLPPAFAGLDGTLHHRAAHRPIVEVVERQRHGAGQRAGVGGILRLRPRRGEVPNIWICQRRRGNERGNTDGNDQTAMPLVTQTFPKETIAHSSMSARRSGIGIRRQTWSAIGVPQP